MHVQQKMQSDNTIPDFNIVEILKILSPQISLFVAAFRIKTGGRY